MVWLSAQSVRGDFYHCARTLVDFVRAIDDDSAKPTHELVDICKTIDFAAVAVPHSHYTDVTSS